MLPVESMDEDSDDKPLFGAIKRERASNLREELSTITTLVGLLKELRELKKLISGNFAHDNTTLFKLSENVNEMRTELQQFKRQSQNHKCFLNEEPQSVLPKLPIGTMGEFENFENEVANNPDVMQQLKSYLFKIGADEYVGFVRACLRKLLTDELAGQYAWQGTKEKPKIRDYKIISLIKETCHHKYKDAVDDTINSTAHKHILHAKDRVKKRMSTMNKSSEETVQNAIFLYVDEQDLLPEFPIHDSEIFDDLEKRLKERSALVEELQTFFLGFDGDDLAEYLRRVLKKLIMDELACKYTWTGTKDKPKVKDLKIIALMREACHLKFKKADDTKISAIIQKHFLHANGRIKKRSSAMKDEEDRL